jgi:hypothetical protein
MKKLFFCLATALTATVGFSQSDSLQKNKDGIYELSAVVNVDSASANDLYSKAKKFVAINFVNAKEVTQLDDDNSKTVIGKGITTVLVNVGIGSLVPVNVKYTFVIQAKDNRYKYSIKNFLFHNTDYTTVALEDESYWYKRKISRKMWPDVKRQIYQNMDIMITALRKNMSFSESTKDW